MKNGLMVFICTLLSFVAFSSRTIGQETAELLSECMQVRYKSMRALKHIPEDPPDVVSTSPDDFYLKFVLENKCETNAYYLQHNFSVPENLPAGFMIYKQDKKPWRARTPSWGRVGSLTSPSAYRWIEIIPDQKVIFEYTDLSKIMGQRSVALYVNWVPSHDSRVEIRANPFNLTRCPQLSGNTTTR